jgi:5'-nucleotidase
VRGVLLNGQPLRSDAVYRVVVSSFLATGGDNFTVFTHGVDGLGAGQDLDALEAYFSAAGGAVVPPATDRIVRVDLP